MSATPTDDEKNKTTEESSSSDDVTQQTPPKDATTSPEVPTTKESDFAEQFEKMLTKYGEDYMRRVVEMAKKDTYSVTLMVPTGKKVPDPLEPEKEIEEFNGTETKNYKRRPISSRDYHRAEKLRAQFQNEKDPDHVADNQARIYQFLAFCYLGMAAQEFNRVADWTEIKLVIDACNHKTLYQPAGTTVTNNNPQTGIS
ncbi:MAG: hypothetical protein ICV68_18275 [Pyrinomonadaceae bacterium]|nr:hypothetical protein [Pyrinomonadaceae bacterium]